MARGISLFKEELRNDETVVEFFSKKAVIEKPAMLWKPGGLEYYFLMYARTFDLNDPREIKFKIFLKYWVKSKLGNLPQKELRNIFLTNYLFIIADQKSIANIPIKRQIISVETFLKLEDPKKN